MLNRTGKNRSTKRRRLMEELFGEDDMEEEDNELDSLEDNDSDLEEEQTSRPCRQPNKEQDHVEGHKRLMNDYFNQDSTYNNWDFERRFRMRKELFVKIVTNVESAFAYFVQKPVLFSFFLSHLFTKCVLTLSFKFYPRL
jgi:hypothetical protein